MLNSKPIDFGKSSGHDNISNLTTKIISVAIIPVAIPLTTGAGTFSTIIIFADQIGRDYLRFIYLFLAIVACTICIYYIFKYSMKLLKILGDTGMNVLIKVMGLITLAIGVQFIIYGVRSAFPHI